MIEFTPWPKIARLNRDITITEKIDGTNAAVGILPLQFGDETHGPEVLEQGEMVYDHHGTTIVYAQSRKTLITPERDNHGFARWVWENAEALAAILGPGVHFGEWWGGGIQRGYGLPKGEKRFSLFNTKRWGDSRQWEAPYFLANGEPIDYPPGLGTVPTLYEGPFNAGVGAGAFQWAMRPWEKALDSLELHGSQASPGFMRPEGIVIYHHAANMMFKVTLEKDEAPKGMS